MALGDTLMLELIQVHLDSLKYFVHQLAQQSRFYRQQLAFACFCQYLWKEVAWLLGPRKEEVSDSYLCGCININTLVHNSNSCRPVLYKLRIQ